MRGKSHSRVGGVPSLSHGGLRYHGIKIGTSNVISSTDPPASALHSSVPLELLFHLGHLSTSVRVWENTPSRKPSPEAPKASIGRQIVRTSLWSDDVKACLMNWASPRTQSTRFTMSALPKRILKVSLGTTSLAICESPKSSRSSSLVGD